MVIIKLDIMRDLELLQCFAISSIFRKQNKINWIEPIEVWGNFRAARKAKVKENLVD